jgi:hypothetical protein
MLKDFVDGVDGKEMNPPDSRQGQLPLKVDA